LFPAREPCGKSLTCRRRPGVFHPGVETAYTVNLVLDLSRYERDFFGCGGGWFNVCDIIFLVWITNAASRKSIEYPDICN
jgi:hypothetical protein